MPEISFNQLSHAYDVVVVGAGPSGCFAAESLDAGLRTLVIDRNVFPRSKPCGGMLVQESMDVLRQFNPNPEIFSHPKKLSLRYLDWDNELETKTKRSFYNVSREIFDYWIFQRMRNSHANCITETKLTGMTQKADCVELTLQRDSQKTIRTKYLIAADGHDSFIRRMISPDNITRYLAIQETVEKNPDDFATFIFDNSITDFYSWVVPKRTSTIIGSAIALGSYSKFELFKAKLREKLTLSPNGRVEAALILRPRSEKEIFLGSGNIMVVGEAAGLISPSTGEGISFALRSGINAAKAVNGSEEILENYRKLCKPLVDEIKRKNEKAKILSDPKKRKEHWHNLPFEK